MLCPAGCTAVQIRGFARVPAPVRPRLGEVGPGCAKPGVPARLCPDGGCAAGIPNPSPFLASDAQGAQGPPLGPPHGMRPGAEMLPLTPPGSDLLMPDMPAESQVRHPAASACMVAHMMYVKTHRDAAMHEHFIGQQRWPPCVAIAHAQDSCLPGFDNTPCRVFSHHVLFRKPSGSSSSTARLVS